jgi:hypothetical protein
VSSTALSPTDVVAWIAPPAVQFDSDWNWADEATKAWDLAARAAGLPVNIVSFEVPDVNTDAAVVEVDRTWYLIQVAGDDGRVFASRYALIALYDDNAGGLYLQGNNGAVWTLPDGHGWFADDANGWFDGQWEPGVHGGQTETTADGLRLVATWQPEIGVRLADGVDNGDLGGTAREYLIDNAR